MLLNPFGELFPRDLTRRQVEHQVFLFVDRRPELEVIQDQKRLHRRVGHALVAINERVVERQ